jgi:hypothetical protein
VLERRGRRLVDFDGRSNPESCTSEAERAAAAACE